jgi:hypothetical protein
MSAPFPIRSELAASSAGEKLGLLNDPGLRAPRKEDRDGTIPGTGRSPRQLLAVRIERGRQAGAAPGGGDQRRGSGEFRADSTELKAILDKLVAAADEARDVGDHAGIAAILAAIDRIGDGDPAEAVYLEWLRAQRSRATGDGSATGR